MEEILVPRRRPAQARSRERFERIVQAARAVLVDVGFESFTFDEVAHRAVAFGGHVLFDQDEGTHLGHYSRVRGQEPRQDMEQGGLTTAVVADDRQA